MTKLIDDPLLADHMGPATLKLSNALATTGIRDLRIAAVSRSWNCVRAVAARSGVGAAAWR
jgi:hypothetical protein